MIFEVSFKVSYISPNEEEIEDIAGRRNSGPKCKKFLEMPSPKIGSVSGGGLEMTLER